MSLKLKLLFLNNRKISVSRRNTSRKSSTKRYTFYKPSKCPKKSFFDINHFLKAYSQNKSNTFTTNH